MKTGSPTAGLEPPGYRSKRARTRRHRRLAKDVGIVLLVAAVVAAGVYWFVFREDRGGAFAAGEPTPTPTAVPLGPSRLTVFAVRGEESVAAVIGAQGRPQPAAVTLPDRMSFVLPGAGEGTVSDAVRLPADALRVAVSNLLGAWSENFLVLDHEELAGLVDRMGGLNIDLPSAFESESGTLGPGPATLTGAQVGDYLSVTGPNLELRWELVLDGLLAGGPQVLPEGVAETNSPEAVAAALSAAQGATVEPLPTTNLGGNPRDPLIQVDAEELPALLKSAFGISGPQPVPVVVENANGKPGVSESVAARLVPAGFRIVLSQNAARFGRPHTAVVAAGEEHLDEARRAQEALGVGKVAISNVPSGLADVTIVIGEDFT